MSASSTRSSLQNRGAVGCSELAERKAQEDRYSDTSRLGPAEGGRGHQNSIGGSGRLERKRPFGAKPRDAQEQPKRGYSHGRDFLVRLEFSQGLSGRNIRRDRRTAAGRLRRSYSRRLANAAIKSGFEQGPDSIQQKLRTLILQNPTVHDTHGFVGQLREPGQNDHRNGWVYSLEFARGGDSVLSGHPIVQQHQIERLALK